MKVEWNGESEGGKKTHKNDIWLESEKICDYGLQLDLFQSDSWSWKAVEGYVMASSLSVLGWLCSAFAFES